MLQFVRGVSVVDRADLMADNTAMATAALRVLHWSSLVFVVCLIGCEARPEQATPHVIRITTGLPGMTFKPLGEALATSFQSVITDTRFEVIETAGSVANLQRLESGEADLGFALADVAYTAFTGSGMDFPNAATRVRAIAVLHPSAVHVLVPANSKAHSVADLRGRIGVGPAGSGTAVTSALLLNAFGVSPKQITNQSLPFISASDALTTGALDAAFVVAADPVDAVQRATNAGARLLEISGDQVRRLSAEYPFLRPGAIPGSTYKKEPRSIQTMLVDVLLLTRADIDDEVVRRITSALFDVLPQLSSSHDFLRAMDIRRAPATPIPLHPGAALYYREQELSR
jgi:TRAP transporter TAXI family solute receptor